MRELRIRAWSPTFKEMHFQNFSIDAFSGQLAWTSVAKLLADANNIIFMQFTGLLDKNGKEIYEGDIVRVPGMNWDNNKKATREQVVRFTEGYFSLGWYPWTSYARQAEIIGNIYENPELIK